MVSQVTMELLVGLVLQVPGDSPDSKVLREAMATQETLVLLDHKDRREQQVQLEHQASVDLQDHKVQ